MTAKPTAAIESIGSRLLQTTRQLFKLPVPDEPLKIFRELTTLPAIRFSETLKPYCGGDEPGQSPNDPDEDIHEADSLRVATRQIQPSSSRTGLEVGNSNEPGSAQRPQATPSSDTPSNDVANIFQAIKALNLDAVRSRKAVEEREAQRVATQEAVTSRFENALTRTAIDDWVPQAGRGDENQSREPVQGPTHQSAVGLPDELPWASKQLPVRSGDAIPAPVTAFRLAQDAPRIAALLQSHFAGNGKNQNRVELVQLPEAETRRAVIDRAYSPEGHPQNTGSMVDIDLLTEKLAEQLELDLMRMYGTSER